MQKRKGRKLLSLLLSLVMVISMLPMSVWAEGETGATWTAVDLEDITAEDTVAITMTKDSTTTDSTTWVLPAATNTSSAPHADVVTLSDGKLTVDPDAYGWTFTAVDGGYHITNSEGKYLYTTNTNNGVRVGGTEIVWSLDESGHYLKASASGTIRYLGVYMSNPDWRAYNNTTGNTAGQVLTLWKLDVGPVNPDAPDAPTADVAGGEVEAGTVVTFSCATAGAVISYSTDGGETWTQGNSYTVNEAVTLKVKATLNGVDSSVATFTYTIAPTAIVSIADALAGSANARFKVQGVVTLVDSRNIYVQDATGGICLYFDTAPTDLALGDTVIFTGSRTTYRGLPELTGQDYEKSSGLTLTAKETTIGALTTADVCTYVHLADLTVTAVSGTTVTVQDAAGDSIQIYRAVLGDTAPSVGDTVDFRGAVGIYNTTLQLRNTLASEIEVSVPEIGAPTADVAAGSVEAGTVVTFSSATPGAVISYSTDGGETWTQGSTYTVNEDVTLQVKATLNGVDSPVVTFAYTVIAVAPISDALAGEANATFTVKGVVTLVDGRNIYVQDATGGICLYFNTAVSDLALGDTVIFTGSRATYRGLPELTGQDYMKSSGLTLTVKDTAIAELTTADVCTYVHLTGLEVTEVYDNNGSYSSPNITLKDADGKTIQIYKAVVGKTDGVWNVAVGDTLDVNAAVGINNTTLQLRNTLASEITVVSSSVRTPTASVASGAVAAGTVVTFSCATAGAVISYSADNGETWTEGSTYTVNEAVTLLVKATLNGADSSIATFTYTIQTEPPVESDLITSLDQLTDGATVAIYSPGHKTAISSKPNGDWYLKANAATVDDSGKVVNFTSDFVWTVRVNADGTYSFYSYDEESNCISVWPSGTYAELTVNPNYNSETVHDWNLLPFSADNHTWYIKSSTLTITKNNTALPVYIEAYLRNGTEVFSGYAPYSSQLSNTDYAIQFYRVDPDDASAAFDDGEWDGVLDPEKTYVAYNAAAGASLGLFKEANYALDAIPTTIEGGKANAGNGAYVFTIGSMGRYYSFEINGRYLATNPSEELFFVDKNADGTIPETAKWYLTSNGDGYIIYNKDASYGGTPVCIEYYSSVFSGWTFKPSDADIFRFNFYEVADGTETRDGVVQAPGVIFDCEDSRYVEQDYVCSFSLDDLAEQITNVSITYTAGAKTGTVTEYEASSDGKSYSFTIPAAEIDGEPAPETLAIHVAVNNSYDITYTGEKLVNIIDEPFFTELTPAPNSQTRDDKRPVISARVGNVGENPSFTMTLNGEEAEAVFENGVLSYTPAKDLPDGRVNVAVRVMRADGVSSEKAWNFTVGIADYQLYFGQLHSHTTYSDGSGSLETALEYIESLPASANVQYVAFTDHSNYFDTTSAANPADALNDQSLMTDASRALWNTYKNTVAAFNARQSSIIAIAGFEMTWSGGPGHINTFDSDGLVSRNNAELNNKNSDAGMKLYYETINKGESLNQFNHPGSTFGNFTDFSYWNEETDAHMFLVEVGNGEGQIGAGGYYPSYEQYTMALDKGWHVAPTNNQDNHKGRWGNANDARDVILTNDFSEQGIYDAIRALRVYATEDKNLQINYTVNDQPMGTIFADDESPATLNVVVTLYDPDASDSVSKVELVSNGGVTAYTWDNSTDLASGQLTAELPAEYSYYYVRVTQKDGDLAVTAPVWVGKAAKLGITGITAPAEVYRNEETTLTTTLFNNEESAATVKSLVYTVNGSQVIGTDTQTYTIPAGGTVAVTFAHTFDTAKLTTVTVTAIVELDGKEHTYTANVELDILDRETEGQVTDIADVRAASVENDTGYRFTIEGVVTSNASGYDKDTAFFDCIYVQDATGGICCFPVSGEYKIGDKVRIVGHTDFYQGEPELQVQTIEVIGTGTVEPTEITAAQLNDRSAEGLLVTIRGTVDSFEEANGLIQTIMVKDAQGNLARVFIDGYITTSEDVANCAVGAQISATGLASYDDAFNAPEGPFPRIRIRDRADVVCTPAAADPIVITKQPVNVSGIQGTFVTFTVEAQGEGLTYLWQALVNDEWVSTNFAASKTPALTAKATLARDGRQYRCLITDANGNTLASDPATLTMIPSGLKIASQPTSVSGIQGTFVTFTVEAEGEGLTYMWQSNVSGKWSNTTFATSKTPALTAKVTEARDGKQYRCVVTDAYGNTVTSEPATLTLLPADIVITLQPTDVSGALDTFVTFTVEAEGEGLTYMWQSCVNGKWSNTTFATSETPSVTIKVTEDRDGRQYRCVITDANGGVVASEAATLHVAD